MQKNKKARYIFSDWEYFEAYNALLALKKKMGRTVMFKWLFLLFPFLFTAVILIFVELDKVLFMSDGFSFINDVSNSFCMIGLFVLSFYLEGIYPIWMKKSIDKVAVFQKEHLGQKDNTKLFLDKMVRMIHLWMLISWIALAFGVPFVMTALKNEESWVNYVSLFTRVIYMVYLGITWKMAIELLGYALIGCYALCRLIPTMELNLQFNNYRIVQKNLQIIAKGISVTVAYALFYVLGAIIIIINDILCAKKYRIEMTFYKYPIAVIVLILAVIAGLCYVLLPVISFYRCVSNQKEKEIERLEHSDEVDKEKKIEEVETISAWALSNTTGKMAILFTPVYSIISLLIQFVSIRFLN